MNSKSCSSQEWMLSAEKGENSDYSPRQPNRKLGSEEKKQLKSMGFIRNFWTPTEDQHLTDLVAKYGNTRWTLISSEIPERSAKRCRERWMNYLNSEINLQRSWTQNQKWLLFLCYRLYGNKWSIISNILKRGDNIVKNQINSLKRKKSCPFTIQLQQLFLNPKEHFKTIENPIEITLIEKIMRKQNIIQNQKPSQNQIKYPEPHFVKAEHQASNQSNFQPGSSIYNPTDHQNWNFLSYYMENQICFNIGHIPVQTGQLNWHFYP